MARFLPVAAGLLLVILTGVAHGVWTNRWGFSHEPAASTARLQGIPLTLGKGGEWVGEERQLDPKQMEIADLAGSKTIEYTNSRTGAKVMALVVCGSAGPVSVHPPDVCYQGAGYQRRTADRYVVEAGGKQAEFDTGTFSHNEQNVPVYLRIFWAWGADGRWAAPANPRWDYRHKPALYKLYVVRHLARMDEPLDKDPCNDLLRALLPELDRQLFAPS